METNTQNVSVGVTEYDYQMSQDRAMTDESVMNDYMSHFDTAFDWRGEERYNPRENSSHRKGRRCGNFFINYSFPRNSDSPIASFWTQYKDDNNENRFNMIHIDLQKVVGQIIDYHQRNGVTAPPPKENVAQTPRQPQQNQEVPTPEPNDKTF